MGEGESHTQAHRALGTMLLWGSNKFMVCQQGRLLIYILKRGCHRRAGEEV